VTATDDVESPEELFDGGTGATKEAIVDLLPRFIGPIQQRPPAYSAMKIDGRRAYDLARRGQDVQLEPRTVNVYDIQLLDFTWPLVRLRVDCGRGTYIRALARDIGAALNVGGYLTQLRRTRIGEYSVEQGVTLEKLAVDGVAVHLSAQ
jgi:tRNA pseudouridine55 synthase